MNAKIRTFAAKVTHPLFPGQVGETVVTITTKGGDSLCQADGTEYRTNYDSRLSPTSIAKTHLEYMRVEVLSLTETTPDEPLAVDLSKVAFAYSGRPGCACGCRGNYRYASAHREWAEKNQGHAIEDSDVSDRSVALTVKKINSLIAAGEGTVMIDPAFISVDTETRSHAAYFAEPDADAVAAADANKKF